jgi:hypothetical protein
MKALPPASSQLELLPRHGLARVEVDPSARLEILRALAEILLAAVDATERGERVDEAR